MNETASLPKLKRIIENLPKDGLVDLFAHFVRVCIKRNVYGGRSVADVAKTVELQALGKFQPQPNQSPMPKTRAAASQVATEIAKELNKT